MISLKKLIHWLPRILSILFSILLSLFALDVFNEYQGVRVILPLLIHLLPSFVLILITIIAWKKELFGAAAFIMMAISYILMVGFYRHWSWYLSISVPALLIGILYLVDWIKKQNKIKK